MKKVILLCMLSIVAMAQDWEYLIYVTGVEFKDKKMVHVGAINENGKKIGVGYGEKQSIANVEMLKKYAGNYKFTEAGMMDVLAFLGQKGWELVSIQGEVNNSNQTLYFKRED